MFYYSFDKIGLVERLFCKKITYIKLSFHRFFLRRLLLLHFLLLSLNENFQQAAIQLAYVIPSIVRITKIILPGPISNNERILK